MAKFIIKRLIMVQRRHQVTMTIRKKSIMYKLSLLISRKDDG